MAPNIESFNFLIRAWTRYRKSYDIADQAIRALRKLENYQSEVDPTVRPNQRSYVMVMDATMARAKLKVKKIRNNRSLCWKSEENGLDEVKLLKSVTS